MTKFLHDFRLLLWKNGLIQWRQKFWTFFELLSPVLMTLVLVALRQLVTSEKQDAHFYKPFVVKGDYSDLLARRVDEKTILNVSSPCFHPTVREVAGEVFPPTVLYFSPNTSLTRHLMGRLADRYNLTYHPIGSLQLYTKGFNSEEALVEEAMRVNNKSICNNTVLGGIVWEDSFSNGDPVASIRYKIRLSNTNRNRPLFAPVSVNSIRLDYTWDTGYTYPVLSLPGPRNPAYASGGTPGYWTETFLSLQMGVDTVIMDYLHSSHSAMYVKLNRYSVDGYVENIFIAVIQHQLPVILMLSFVISVLYIIRSVVQEKEKKLKEYMKCMGLSNSVHWLSHFVSNLFKLLLAVALITVALCSPFNGKKILDKSDPSVIFVFLLIYSAASICYGFTVSVFFKKGNSAAAVGGIVWFLIYIPYFLLQPRYSSLLLRTKLASSLFLNTAMAFGAQVIGIFEGKGTGVQWRTLGTPGAADDELTMAHVWGMMVVDMVVCVVISWYVEGVFPGDEGVPRKWWFPFTVITFTIVLTMTNICQFEHF